MLETQKARILMTLPLGYGVGSHVVSHALCKSLQEAGLKAKLLSPFTTGMMCLDEVELALEKGHFQRVLDQLCHLVEEAKEGGDLVILEGVSPGQDRVSSTFINEQVAKALAADVIFIACPTLYNAGSEKMVSLAGQLYLEGSGARSLGLIVNKFGANHHKVISADKPQSSALQSDVLAVLPWHEALFSFGLKDLADKIPLQGALEGTIKSFELVSREKGDVIDEAHHLYIVDASSYETAGLQDKACVLVAGGQKGQGSLQTSVSLTEVMFAISELVNTPPLETDESSLEAKATILAPFINPKELINRHRAPYGAQDSSGLSATGFRYFLKKCASKEKKRIVLPESDDDRVLQAARIMADEGIAHPILIGQLDVINKRCIELGIEPFSKDMCLEPQEQVEALIEPLVQLREHKGMDQEGAKKALTNPVVLSTMLLKTGVVDGLVAGANTSTADTIRPAFQLIKTAHKGGMVSSLFFICFAQKVAIFADCAVNIDPTAEEMAAIAIETSKTAALFGFAPKIAMLSYSTLDSGKGGSVDKVREAVALIKKQAPNLVVDGPLQFDAAFDTSVAEKKAPKSEVAGQANIYIFPSLDAGNIAYKAATKASHVLAIGPVLQGLNQPVNDLSRGASVDDIVYTAAITAITS